MSNHLTLVKTFQRMEYTGKIPELRGKIATLRQDNGVLKDHVVADKSKFVLAQFKEEGLKHGGIPLYRDWHHFMLKDFTPPGNKPVF